MSYKSTIDEFGVLQAFWNDVEIANAYPMPEDLWEVVPALGRKGRRICRGQDAANFYMASLGEEYWVVWQ